MIFPIESISIATKIIAGILIAAGLANIIYFFIDKDIKSRMDTMYFLLSLVGIGVGIYTFLNPMWLVTAINVVVGVAVGFPRASETYTSSTWRGPFVIPIALFKEDELIVTTLT